MAQSRKTLRTNFKSGDLLFGFNSLRNQTQFLEFNDDNPITIDKYIHEVISNITTPSEQKYDIRLGKKYEDELQVDGKSHNGVSNQYILSALQHWQTNVPEKLKPHHFFPNSEKKLTPENRMLRRACKAALLDNRITPHFILSEMNLTHTFDRKASLKEPVGSRFSYMCLYDSFTSAEFHFILKNWQAMENRIKFYLQITEGKNKINYLEIDLFYWIAQQDKKGKEALLGWARDRFNASKLSQQTLNKINEAIKQEKDPKFHAKYPQRSSGYKPMMVPATPKPTGPILAIEEGAGAALPTTVSASLRFGYT